MVYQNHKLFQSKTFTATSDFSQKIISSKINESEQQRQNKVSVEMVFNPTVSFSMNGNKNSVYSFFFLKNRNLFQVFEYIGTYIVLLRMLLGYSRQNNNATCLKKNLIFNVGVVITNVIIRRNKVIRINLL